MKIRLFLTPDCAGAARLQTALDSLRGKLHDRGIWYSEALGQKNHTRLFMAVTDPGHVDPLRANRGHGPAARQVLLHDLVGKEIEAEIERRKPEMLVISAAQLLTSLTAESELERLHALLARHSGDVGLILHVDEPARMLARFHAEQVLDGRHAGLDKELALAGEADWRAAALADWGPANPDLNAFPEIHAAPFWLDLRQTARRWQAVFGAGSLSLRPYHEHLFNSADLPLEIAESLGIDAPLGRIEPARDTRPLAAEALLRMRHMNALFERALATGRVIPRALWRKLLGELVVPGAPLAPGSLSPVSRALGPGLAELAQAHPAIRPVLAPDPALPDWAETDPANGYRATQFMAVFLPRIDKATAEAREAAQAQAGRRKAGPGSAETLSPAAEALLPPLAKATFANLAGGRFAPHNRLGRIDEEAPAPAYAPMPPRKPRGRSTGRVIVGCMKNEGPYIAEWVAYHRAIGVDNFLIYTNGCEDGTAEILDRLQEMGILQHRNNDDWKGNSPQQAALNKSLKEPVVKNAEWLIHIDVDEFMNIRTGNGTLDDLFAAVPDATNFAMTWRLFGHDGVTAYEDRLVIEQFEACAPKYCPKPHTVWGFKTMFRNTGAYAKLSCHRPNKLDAGLRDKVKWVNGSGEPMKDSLKDNGWRSGIDNIGYDLIQLNHYALRSAESFLIKRQRGRALHVDRSIGLNYWIRMDWCDHRDITIQRNIPRTRAELAHLMQDAELARLHAASVAWHKDRVAGLHQTPEFEELYQQALTTRLSGLERVAYALALDLES